MSRYQVPENLIDQVQILLRKEASLESFNPNDPSIPPPPTLEDAIAGFLTSEDHQLRCRNCKGELLRGSESIVCVYCGLGQKCGESPPKDVGFKSTIGFRWLLKSLRLDGSENIGASIGGTQFNRQQSSFKDGVLLSNFLNLNLKWPDESSRLGIINESQLAVERPGTLVGVDLAELSREGSSSSTSAIHSEQFGTNEQIEYTKAAPVTLQRSLNLFEEKKSSEPSLRANEGENDDDDSGWAAEFQSAGHEHTPSFEAAGPPDDNASHINSALDHNEVEKLANVSSSPAHPRNDLTSDDLDLGFTLPSRSKQSEGIIVVENADKVLEPVDASTGFAWPLDDLQKTATADPSLVKNEVVDDSFDEWNDFRSSTDVQTNNCEPSTATPSGTENRGPDLSDGWKDFTGSAGTENKQPETDVSRAPDGDFLDAWNDFTVSSSTHEIKVDTTGGDADASKSNTLNQVDSVGVWSNGVSMAVEGDQLLGLETKPPATVTTKEADDSFNLWNDFKSSTGETQQVDIVKGADDRLSAKDDKAGDLWDDFSGLGASKSEQNISGEEKAINGSFSSWNDPTESSSVSISKPMNNDISFGEWGDFSSSAVSNSDQHQSIGKNVAETQTVEQEDSFSSWSNLKSSGTQVEDSFLSGIITESSQGQIDTGKASESLKAMDGSTFDVWGDFGQSTLMPEKQVQAAEIKLSDNKQIGDDTDFFSGWIGSSEQSANAPNNRVNSNGVTEHVENSNNQTDDSFDAWTGFTTSSTNMPASQPLSSSADAPADKEAVKNDDIFDSWNVFTSSSNMQAGDTTIAPKENMSEISFFDTSTNSQGLERDDKQDILFGVTSEQNGPSEQVGSTPEVSDLVRTENGGAEHGVDGFPEQSNQSGTNISSGIKSSDVETLISEMHDLSFMLETSLKVPGSQP